MHNIKPKGPSQLGPWQRELEDHLRQSTNSHSPQLKQQLTLPRVDSPRKKYTVAIKETKQKIWHPMKIKPIEAEVAQKIRLQRQVEAEARKSRTLSFQPPMISFYNKNHPKINKNKEKSVILVKDFSYKSQELDRNKANSASKISLIDFLVSEHRIVEEKANRANQTVQKFNQRQKEYSKKRSLKEILKYLKKPNRLEIQNETSDKKRSFANRYQGYHDFIGMSLQAEPRYIPYFQARKSYYSLSKKQQK